MTEEEWLRSDDLKAMFHLLGRSRLRKRLLFASACCRRISQLLTERGLRVIDCCERTADGTVAPLTALDLPQTPANGLHEYGTSLDANTSVSCLARWQDDSLDHLSAAQWAAAASADAPAEWQAQALLVRCVFGNPFRPVTFSPSWRTDTAVALARQMYESREFGAMPILADALQDAGCDSEDLLNHCRDANATHVRGCWVADLALGLS